MVDIIVPATTANMGPGFDCFGCALTLYARFRFSWRPEGLHITGCPEAYRGAKNLAYRAYAHACDRLHVAPGGLAVDIRSDIPAARGLGSSAAFVLAGITAAFALHRGEVAEEEVLALALQMEGHPDNIAPALLGGMQASLIVDGKVHTAAAAVHPSYAFLALIPPFELPTDKARGVLPKAVSMADAAHNVSCAAMLLKALASGDAGLLRLAGDDRLHQPYRYPLIPGADILRDEALRQGADMVFISGAGSSLMCLHRDPVFPQCFAAWLHETGSAWQTLQLAPDSGGLQWSLI
jgi:homoserine kinase